MNNHDIDYIDRFKNSTQFSFEIFPSNKYNKYSGYLTVQLRNLSTVNLTILWCTKYLC